MSVLKIRDLDQATSALLYRRANLHGTSIEDEARQILTDALREQDGSVHLVDAIRRRVETLGGLDIPEVPREPMRPAPNLPE